MTPTPARVRVFLPTYRRGPLLTRAIESLRAQTMPHWICELHNDDPADDVPARLLRDLGDPRFEMHTHPTNLGPTAAFNLFFRATAEPFYALLEDDNWWEPRFLERMIDALEAAPDVRVAWCNQRIWLEGEDGSWTDSGREVSPRSDDGRPRRIVWGDLRQALGAMHANGAMLVRSVPGESFPTPPVPFAWAEAFRERLLPYPLLYVPDTLAAFSATQQTSRGRNAAEWTAFQIALLRSFVRHAVPGIVDARHVWDSYRAQSPAPTNVFLWAGLLAAECRPFLGFARAADWVRFVKSVVGHPVDTMAMLRILARHGEWWAVLESRLPSDGRPRTPRARALSSERIH